MGWAEAFYLYPYCHQYIEIDDSNQPYHWMLHEATHQLNFEVSHFRLQKWAEEGIASYFSTAKIEDGKIKLGTIDENTYPIWWITTLPLSGNLEKDKVDHKIMSVKSIIKNEKPLKMNKFFNLYYIHWFSLVHFLLEGEQKKYRHKFIKFISNYPAFKDFEENVGLFDDIEPEWYRHLINMQQQLLLRVSTPAS